MTTTVLDLLGGFLFGTIPWQLWLFVGIAGSIALAVISPSRLGMAGAAVFAVLTLTTASFSRGTHYGEGLERASWEAKVDAEKARLRVEFAKEAEAERSRADAAEATTEQRTKERDDAILLAAKDPHAGDVAVPEYLATRLCQQTRRCSGPDGKAPDPARPHSLRHLLQRRGPLPTP